MSHNTSTWPGRASGPAPPGWLFHFSAPLAAVLLAGVVLPFGIRLWIRYTIAGAFKSVSAREGEVIADRRRRLRDGRFPFRDAGFREGWGLGSRFQVGTALVLRPRFSAAFSPPQQREREDRRPAAHYCDTQSAI